MNNQTKFGANSTLVTGTFKYYERIFGWGGGVLPKMLTLLIFGRRMVVSARMSTLGRGGVIEMGPKV